MDAVGRAAPLYDEPVRRILVAIVASLLLASCGGGDLSLAEYNTEGMALATAMEERIFVLDAEWDSQTATAEDARAYWDQRIDAYDMALAGFEALVSPAIRYEAADVELFLAGRTEVIAYLRRKLESIDLAAHW